jgi:hypothetical protein
MIVLPAERVRWTNETNHTVELDPSQDLPITWSGGDAQREYVVIQGSFEALHAGISSTFICTAQSGAGSFTIPAHVLQTATRGFVKREVWWQHQGVYGSIIFSVRSFPVAIQAHGLDSGELWYVSESFAYARFK